MDFISSKCISFKEERGRISFEIMKENAGTLAKYIFENKNGILRMMLCTDERHLDGTFKIRLFFSLPEAKDFLILFFKLKDGECYPSITPYVPVCHWYEREIMDMFGIKPEGHPDPRRLVFHESFPANSHPLRKDWSITEIELKEWGEGKKIKVPYEFFKVDGEEVYEIPVGPVHAGIIEPGHFRFSAVGETIFFLEARFFYTHKGIEKHFEKIGFQKGVGLSERVSGTSSFSHSTAYCLAVENMCNIDIPERAKAIRTILLELERIYNHIGDIGNMCAGTGLQVGNAYGAYIKEKLMRLNYKISGHRYIRGVNKIGGVTRDILGYKDEILRELNEIQKLKEDFMRLLLGNLSHVERLENTGRLAKDIAIKLGATGIAARASGIEDDIRIFHPHLLYGKVDFKLITEESGDVLARMMVRAKEVDESFKIVKQIFDMDFPKDLSLEDMNISPSSEGIGYVESPRGSVFYFVKSGENGEVERVKVRSSSFCNWPLMPYAVHGNIIPDFPLCNKSFNLSYSGCDM